MTISNIIIDGEWLSVERERGGHKTLHVYSKSRMSAKNKRLLARIMNYWMWEYDDVFNDDLTSTQYLFTQEPVVKPKSIYEYNRLLQEKGKR